MPSDHRPRRRLLIVDSDDDFVRQISAVLFANGYDVEQAAAGAVLHHVGQFQSDLLLCEIDASGVTGELLARISAAHPQLKVLTMANRPDHRRRAAPQEAVQFIDRNSGVAQIAAAIDQCFGAPPDDRETAGERNRAELEFLAKISHELRTPLNAIIGFSELIIREPRAPIDQTQQKAYVQDIHASGKHLLEVINDILDFAKAESGKLLLHESEVEIAESMTTIERMMGPRIRDAGLAFRQVVPQHCPSLWCDERKLKRMLLNLLTNAVKFTPAGGEIEIEVAEVAAGLVISVRDTGIGIPEADLQRVLEPFVQVESSFARSHEGTGLGLSLVKSMMEIHGGSLVLESEVNRGTVARLLFPQQRLGACGERGNPAADRPRRESIA
jgi:signal transduction histidine kinase